MDGQGPGPAIVTKVHQAGMRRTRASHRKKLVVPGKDIEFRRWHKREDDSSNDSYHALTVGRVTRMQDIRSLALAALPSDLAAAVLIITLKTS